MPAVPDPFKSPQAEIAATVRLAISEDIGAGDITSQLLIPEGATAQMQLVARQELIFCGAAVAAEVFRQLDARVSVVQHAADGQRMEAASVIATVEGAARSLLTGERTVLNLTQRLSSVATLTQKYVRAVEGTGVVILDTRKTMPGMRVLDKFAVRAGGGQNHRMRLDDMILIKDNHIAIAQQQGMGIAQLVAKLRADVRVACPIVVECDTLEQVRQAAEGKPDRLLLDNMDTATLREAVALVGARVALEASGGVNLATVRDIAQTGVNYISVGALTHSATAVDIGADIRFF